MTQELKNDFDRCAVEASLCAWEYVVPLNDVEGGYWCLKFEEEGTGAMRHHVIDMGLKIDAAYRAVSEAWAGFCYDWCFVPDLLDALNDPINASEAEFVAAARTLNPRV